MRSGTEGPSIAKGRKDPRTCLVNFIWVFFGKGELGKGEGGASRRRGRKNGGEKERVK